MVAYIIRGGFAQVLGEQAGGSQVILAFLWPGEVVSQMRLVANLGRSATVIVHAGLSLFGINRAVFQDCLRTMPTLTYNRVGILSRRLRLADARIEALAMLDIEGRVTRLLVAFAKEYVRSAPNGDLVSPTRPTQNEPGGLIGASRVHVNRILGLFRRLHFLSVDGQSRMILRGY